MKVSPTPEAAFACLRSAFSLDAAPPPAERIKQLRALAHTLPGSGGMCQRNKHLAAAPTLFTNVILDCRMAALEPMLVPQSFKSPVGGVALLAVSTEIPRQPLANKAREAISLRSFNISRSPVTGRYGKLHDLLHARARHPKRNCCCLLAQAASTRGAHLPIKFHDQNTPALLSPEKAKAAKFHSVRSKTIPPVAWQTFALPFPAMRATCNFLISLRIFSKGTSVSDMGATPICVSIPPVYLISFGPCALRLSKPACLQRVHFAQCQIGRKSPLEGSVNGPVGPKKTSRAGVSATSCSTKFASTVPRRF